MKISQKFLAFFLPAALLPLLAVSAFAYFYSVSQFKTQVSERIEGIAAHQQQRLVIQNDHNIALLADISTKLNLRTALQQYDLAPTTATQASLNSQLSEYLNANPQLYRISIASPNGRLVASTDPTQVGQSVADKECFKVGRSAATTSIFFKDAATGTLRQWLATPFYLENKFIGVALLETSPSTLRAVIQDYSELGATGGTFLARQYPDGQLKYMLPLRFNANAALTAIGPSLAGQITADTPDNHLATATDDRGHTVLLAASPVERTDWRLVVKFDQDEVLAPVYRLRNVFLVIFLLVALITILAGLAAAEFFTRPIRSLTDVVQRIQAGDLTRQAPVRSNDEIGILSSTFNAMTANLTESRARLMASILGLKQGFILVDNDGRIQTMNAAARRLLGLPETGDLPLGMTLARALDGMSGFDASSRLAACINAGIPIDFRDILYRDTTYFNIYFTPVTFNNQVRGAVVLLADITQEKVLQHSRDEFFSIAAHELRTPLTAIRGNSSIIKEYYWKKLPDDDVRDMIDDISDSSKRLIGLVNDFLDASRLELGSFKYALEPVDLIAVGQSVQKEYQAAGTLQKLTLNVDVPSAELPHVFADPNRAKQIIINFVGNALKFTKEGSITISFHPGPREVEVQIADTGQGISLEGQRLLFHKFQQANDNFLNRDSRGSGLGLYISRLLTEGMGGTIRLVHSEPGKGTTFGFTLPIATAAQLERTKPLIVGSVEPAAAEK